MAARAAAAEGDPLLSASSLSKALTSVVVKLTVTRVVLGRLALEHALISNNLLLLSGAVARIRLGRVDGLEGSAPCSRLPLLAAIALVLQAAAAAWEELHNAGGGGGGDGGSGGGGGNGGGGDGGIGSSSKLPST